MQIGVKRAKTLMRCVRIPAELPFCMPPLVVGTAEEESKKKNLQIFR